MRARRWRQRRRGHRGRFAHRDQCGHRDQRGHRGYRGRCEHRNCLAHRRRERRDRNKRQRRGNPPPKYEISLGCSSRHAVLHRQTRRFGHRSERCAATSCTRTTDRNIRGQHRQPRGFTSVFGQIPLPNHCKTAGNAVKKASEAHLHTSLIGASGRRASVRRGTHRGTDSSSTPDRSKG